MRPYRQSVYNEVSEESVGNFFQRYRGGLEESTDLRHLYTKHGGDMPMVFMWLMCSDPKLDSHRCSQNPKAETLLPNRDPEP
jgi:hypothetical protein